MKMKVVLYNCLCQLRGSPHSGTVIQGSARWDRTGRSEMETVIIMWRLEMTHVLLFLTAVFIPNLRKQRDGEKM